MLFYCLKCRKNTEIKNPKAVKTENITIDFIKVCNSKKSEFLKEQEACELLSNFG